MGAGTWPKRGPVHGNGSAGRRLRRDEPRYRPGPGRHHEGPGRHRAGSGRLPSRAATAAQAQPARHAPTGFWSGSDSWPVPVSGSAPYRAPGIGGAYGGYVGMAGQLVVLAGLPRGLPGLVLGKQRAGRHQLHQVRAGYRDRRLLVHGRPRRRPRLQRDRGRGRRLGRAAGGADAGQHGEGARHLPGRVHGRRTARGRARVRQRMGGRLQLAVQRAGEAPRYAGCAEPGRLQRVLELHRHPLQLQGGGLLRPGDLDRRSSAPAAPPRSRTPTSGPTSRRPRAWRRPPAAGA